MKFGIVTDTHLTSPERPPARFHNLYDFRNTRSNFASALDRHTAGQVDAIIMLGDLANNGDETHHRLGLEMLAAMSIPVWVVPGNHDCEERVTALSERLAALPTTSVQIPTPAGEIVNGIRIAGIPTNTYDTDARWTTALPETAAWGDDLVLMVSHVPALSLARLSAEERLNYAGDTGNLDEVANLLRARTAPTLVIHGHLHLRQSVIDGVVLQIGFAAIVEPPHATAFLDVASTTDSITVTVRHESVAPFDVETVPVLSPDSQTFRFSGERWEEV